MSHQQPIQLNDAKKTLGSIRPSTKPHGAQRANCPVCDVRGVASDLSCVSASGRLQYFLRCPNCRSLFDQEPETANYEEGYYLDNPLLDLKLYVEKAASLRLFSHFVLEAERALKLAKPDSDDEDIKGRLLEVGCGPGLLLDVARFRGWEVLGVEPNEEAAKWAAATLGLNVLQEPLGADPPVRDADIVIASEVIEHLEHPDEFTKAICDSLQPNGVALFTTPNA